MKKRLRNDNAPFDLVVSNQPVAEGSVLKVTADLRARLQMSRAALGELAQALLMSEKNYTGTQYDGLHNKIATLVKSNTYFRLKLVEIERKTANENYLAYHDALTGLPNRRLLQDRLHQVIAQASRQKKRVALVFFDVDGFKEINSRLGHINGDRLLQAVAQRLSACLRTADTACRYGGDEFIVLLPEVEGRQSAAIVEKKIRTQLAAPYLVDNRLITVTFSLGTAVYPIDARNQNDLIRLADAAMYNMKHKSSTAASAETLVDSMQRLSVDQGE